MSRESALAIILAVAVLVVLLVVRGWRRRARRDAGLSAPAGDVPPAALVCSSFSGLYVATTAHEEPLERLAIRGLGFRSKVDITITDRGVALDLTGQPRLFLPSERLVAADQSTVAIDRVVEAGGLTRLVWRVDGEQLVDSFFRPQDASARALAIAFRPALSTSDQAASAPAESAQSGTDA